MRKQLFTGITILFTQICFAQPVPQVRETKSISGFNTSSANAQVQLESKFDAGLSRENIGQNIKRLSAKPHAIGSAAGKEFWAYTKAGAGMQRSKRFMFCFLHQKQECLR
jgi:hypothetical protein